MSIEYVMPKLAMAMNEGTVNEWLVDSGAKVEKGQILATVETEKVAYDLESPLAGYLHITVEQGETVPVETQIGIFVDTEEELAALVGDSAPASPAPTPAFECGAASVAVAAASEQAQAAVDRAPGERIKASPLARKLAKDNSLDLALLSGSGPGGRIVKRDIVLALENKTVHENQTDARVDTVAPQSGLRELSRIPMSGMRKVISDRMLDGMQTSAQLSSSWESDITNLIALRNKFVAREESLGTKVSMNAFIVKAMVSALKTVPVANSCIEGDEVIVYETVNMGFAVAMPTANEYESGLMVGVLHDVGRMGVVEIDKGMKALIDRLRNGQATSDDLKGSTITLSSTAGIGPPGMKSTPILNAPNSTLVGPSTPIERLVMHEGEAVARTMMPIALTFNHCAYDGEPASRFAKALNDCLENPELMLI